MKRLVIFLIIAIMLMVNVTYAKDEDNVISVHREYIVEIDDGVIELNFNNVCIESFGIENDILLMSIEGLTQSRDEIIVNAAKIIIQNEGSYGSVNKNDNNHGMSIGKFQWNSYWGRALPLLQTIVKANPRNAEEILGTDLYDEIANNSKDFWNHKNRTATDDEAERISALLVTEEGKAAQDALIAVDAATYVDAGIKLGLTSGPALVYYADLRNQMGNNSDMIATNAAEKVGDYEKITLYELHQAAISYSSKYHTRRNRTYDFAMSLGWSESLCTKIGADAYDDDSNWYFDVSVENYTEDATIFAVMYDENGKMLASATEDLDNDGTATLSISKENKDDVTLFGLENENNKSTGYVKIFAWDKDLKPIAEIFELGIE